MFKLTMLVLSSIIHNLKKALSNSKYFKTEQQIMTFFDNDYPLKLKKYIYMIPIIYYRGDKSLFNNCSCAIITERPSYYTIRSLNALRKENQVITFCSKFNCLTKESNLCDIIYCNDVKRNMKRKYKLAFSFGSKFNNIHELQLTALIINNLFVLSGYINCESFQLVDLALDNGCSIYALPTNIYVSGNELPNNLIANGCEPILNKI